MAGLKESLYTKRLRQSFKRPEDQKLFEEMPKGTDLGEEIRVARMQVIRYQDLLNDGTDVIFVKDTKNKKPLAQQLAEDGTADVECKTVALNVHDLLRDSLANLRALCATQDQIHPGSDIGGNLRLTITLAGQSKPRLPIPDLTADDSSSRLLPATGSPHDVEAVRSDRSSTGYEADE